MSSSDEMPKFIVHMLDAPTEADWMRVKAAALFTMRLKPKTPPDIEWKRRMLLARHSPIREAKVTFVVENCPSYVSVHLVRHFMGMNKYISTQRNDRQSKYDRRKAPQDAPVGAWFTMNLDALITVAQKRLCVKAAPETRQLIRNFADTLIKSNPEFDKILAPPCEWYGLCTEFRPCGRFPTVYDRLFNEEKKESKQ